jgi:iron complex transport system substrate-binding protein
MITRRRWQGTVLAVALSMLASAAAVASPRFVSINLCTDQLLLALADRDTIAGVSMNAADAERSAFAARAVGLRRLSGTAEEVVTLAPTRVFAGRYDRRTTRAMLQRQGVALDLFDIASTPDQVRTDLRRAGALLGAPGRADAAIAALDAALLQLRSAAARPWRTLPLDRRGYVAGPDSLTGRLIAEAGLVHAAAREAPGLGGFVALETLVVLDVDLLILTRDGPAEDQGTALLSHPALARKVPPGRRLVLPERLTICGGPMLTEAALLLASRLAALK